MMHWGLKIDDEWGQAQELLKKEWIPEWLMMMMMMMLEQVWVGETFKLADEVGEGMETCEIGGHILEVGRLWLCHHPNMST